MILLISVSNANIINQQGKVNFKLQYKMFYWKWKKPIQQKIDALHLLEHYIFYSLGSI